MPGVTSDDWRLRVDLHEAGLAHTLTERLDATRLEHNLETAFHDRIAVSRDGARVFCYAGTRAQAEAAEELIRSLAQAQGWEVEYDLEHWHPTAEEWEGADVPLPGDDAARAREHGELIARERAECAERGFAEFEVRVDCTSKADAERFAAQLRAEGVPVVQRHQYLLVSATDEDAAAALAERLRAEAPAGATATVEGTLLAAESEMPGNPFAVFGGLGG